MKSVSKNSVFYLQTCLLGALLCFTLPSFAKDSITASQAWVRPTVPGQEVTGAFLTLQSTRHARLIKVESAAAESAEIHSMSMHDGVMHMQELKELLLPAGKPVKLAPGGFHIMLINVKKQLREGDTVALTLTIRNDDKTIRTTHVKAVVGTPK